MSVSTIKETLLKSFNIDSKESYLKICSILKSIIKEHVDYAKSLKETKLKNDKLLNEFCKQSNYGPFKPLLQHKIFHSFYSCNSYNITNLHIIYNIIRNKKDHTNKNEYFINNPNFILCVSRLQKHIEISKTSEKRNSSNE